MERIEEMAEFYMAGCSHAFTTARVSVHQALLSKPDERAAAGCR